MMLPVRSKTVRIILVLAVYASMSQSFGQSVSFDRDITVVKSNQDGLQYPFACNLVVTNPAAVCAPATVNLTIPALTVGSTPGVLTYWTNPAATSPLTNPAAVATSGTYYIKTTDGLGCTDIKPVTVAIDLPTTLTPYLAPVCPESQADGTTLKFDFNNMGQSGFNITYTVNGGPLITVPFFTSPSNYVVTGLTPGAIVIFNIKWVGICAQKTITSQTKFAPTFTLPSALCVGTALPTISNNGIPGTWNPPAIISVPGGTDNYVFIPANYNNCLSTHVVHIDDIVPTPTTFNTVTPSFCQNSVAQFPVNTNSPQITGTWSPAAINTAVVGTATYTFTPNPTLFPCTTQRQITVTIRPTVTPTFNAIPQICQGTTPPALPTSSTNTPPITGTWNSAINTTSAGTTFYTFTPNAGQCTPATLTQMSVTVKPMQTPNFVAFAPICSGSSVPILANTSPNGISGTWSPPTINGATVGTAAYTFTPTTGQCASPQILNVTIVPQAVTGFPSALQLCSGASSPLLATTSPNGITGTWSQPNINITVGGTYTFTPAAGECSSAHNLTVTIIPRVSPDFSVTANYCQAANAPALATSSPNGITGSWSPAAINTNLVGNATYTFTADANQCAILTHSLVVSINPTQTPDFASIPSICSGSTAPILAPTSPNGITGTWSPNFVSNTTTRNYTFTPTPGQCASPQVLNVSVNSLLHPDFSPNIVLCSATTAPVLANTSPNGITGSWSPAMVDNLSGGTYVFTPNPGQCAETHTLTVTITPVLSPSFATTLSICQNETPPVLLNTSPNGVIGTWLPTVIDTSVLGVANYTFTSAPGQCASVTHPLQVTVNANQTPNFPLIAPFCEDDVAPILATTSPNGIIGSWSPAIVNNLNSGQYTFTPTAGQCAASQVLAITVTRKTIPAFTPVAPFCAGDMAPVLPLISNNAVTGTWLPATVDNMLSADYFFTPDAPQCAAPKTFRVTVNQPIDPDFHDLAFCIGSAVPLLGPLSPNGISGSWMPVVIDNDQSASYTFTPNVSECANPQTINVTINQETLNSVTWTVSNYFSDNQIVTVLASDAGNYVYQLDDGAFQQSNVFDSVGIGPHTITVKDINGCSLPISENVLVIGYPHFFTPNGDGFNDAWNIYSLHQQTDASIFIFDRYGKLLKEIMPNGLGWDGLYNGNPMPSSDYWFTVTFTENGIPKQFASHFSLKR